MTLCAMMSESKTNTLPAEDVPVAFGPADTFKSLYTIRCFIVGGL